MIFFLFFNFWKIRIDSFWILFYTQTLGRLYTLHDSNRFGCDSFCFSKVFTRLFFLLYNESPCLFVSYTIIIESIYTEESFYIITIVFVFVFYILFFSFLCLFLIFILIKKYHFIEGEKSPMVSLYLRRRKSLVC